jgi:large subunit ribosomal protein L3
MDAIVGRKVGMTQVFTKGGECVPVTVIQVGRCIAALKKTPEKDGYQAVLLAYGERKKKHTNKPLQGTYDKLKLAPAKKLIEMRDQDIADDAIGKQVNVDIFGEGDLVSVIGVSKGKGFAGVMKRFNFAGAPASRGSHEKFRGGGSIGMHTYPGRVLKGKGMPGRMGGDTIHTKNLSVVRVDKDNNILLLRGSVPGANGGMIKIIKSKKA